MMNHKRRSLGRGARRILACAAALALCGTPLAASESFAAEEGGAFYETVVPLRCGWIATVSGELMVTADSDPTGQLQANCYEIRTLDGETLLTGLASVKFYRDWIVVGRLVDGDMKFGVCTRDFQERVPCIYTSVNVDGGSGCIAVDGVKYVRPGAWEGYLYRYDLESGQMVEDMGYGREDDYPVFFSPGTIEELNAAWDLAFDGPAGVNIWRTGEDENQRGAMCRAYNGEGQLLLDFTPYCLKDGYNTLQSGWGGTLLYGYAGPFDKPMSQNYVFSGRGRLIAQMEGTSFRGCCNGDYICVDENSVFGIRPYLLNRDGEVVFEPGVFDSYDFDSETTANERFWQTVSYGGPYNILVSKEGKYGIIRLPKYTPKPSAWAETEAGEAARLGLVPEDIRVWWRDSCTREEFCRMLVPALEEGGISAEASATSGGISFEDCGEPAVLRAAGLGIVSGTSAGRFSPNHFVTREEAAVMLIRAAELLGLPEGGAGEVFADEGDCEPWSLPAVRRVGAIASRDGTVRLMKGNSGGAFAPKESITVEQAAATLLHLTQLAQESGRGA